MLQEQHRGVWWHFQFGWTRTNQEVSQGTRGFSCFSCLTGMAPAQAMTRYLLDGSRNRRPFCCLGFFPVWGSQIQMILTLLCTLDMLWHASPLPAIFLMLPMLRHGQDAHFECPPARMCKAGLVYRGAS